MSKVAIVTDSNSGITQSEAKEYGVTVMPMPFFINDQTYYEDIDLTQEDFYQKLSEDANISTSMPLVGNVTDTWDELLQEYDEIVHIPMSSGLSGSCETAIMLSLRIMTAECRLSIIREFQSHRDSLYWMQKHWQRKDTVQRQSKRSLSVRRWSLRFILWWTRCTI